MVMMPGFSGVVSASSVNESDINNRENEQSFENKSVNEEININQQIFYTCYPAISCGGNNVKGYTGVINHPDRRAVNYIIGLSLAAFLGPGSTWTGLISGEYMEYTVLFSIRIPQKFIIVMVECIKRNIGQTLNIVETMR